MTPYNFMGKVSAMFNKEDDLPVSIFAVPNAISSSKPEAYLPQAVGLGPVYHFRRDLKHMQMHMLAEAKRIHRRFAADVSFTELAMLVENLEGAAAARASYDVYLDMEDDDLAGIMAVDTLFLFSLLSAATVEGDALTCLGFPCRPAEHNPAGCRQLSRETALQEVVMLANQIPIPVIKVVLMIECWKVQQKKEMLRGPFPRLLTGFCRVVSPWKIKAVEYPPYMALKHFHILDLLYHLITLPDSPKPNPEEEEKDLQALDAMADKVTTMLESIRHSNNHVMMEDDDRFLLHPPKLGSSMKDHATKILDIAKDFAPLQYQKPIELIRTFINLDVKELGLSAFAATSNPTQKEAALPRASELRRAGINLCVADHISAIEFVPELASFLLPFVEVHPYSEVLIRNLVAYESMIKPKTEPMVLNRYVELMRDLVETAEDVKVLKSAGIVASSEMMSDEEVADMFRGMSKASEKTNTEGLDRVVASVIGFYGGVRSVRGRRFLEKWGRVGWSLSRVFVIVLLLVLMAIQAFCSVYECHSFGLKTNAS